MRCSVPLPHTLYTSSTSGLTSCPCCQLAVELNAQPVGGSPFPVFFSPPESSPSHLLGAISGDLPGESRGGVPANVSREQLAILASQGPSTFPQISIMVHPASACCCLTWHVAAGQGDLYPQCTSRILANLPMPDCQTSAASRDPRLVMYSTNAQVATSSLRT